MEDKVNSCQPKNSKASDINMLFHSYSEGRDAHEYKFYELEITLLGDGMRTINGTNHPVRRGEVHIIRPGDIHSFQVDGTLKTFLIQFSSKYISGEMSDELSGSDRAFITYLSNDECDAFEYICNSLDLLKLSENLVEPATMNKLLEVLISIFRSSFNNRKRAKVASRDPQDKMQQILDWMQMHYRTYIDADDVAKQFHFNTAYLRRLFKDRVGMSIMQYLKELRLEYARSLLVTTSLKISDVCDRSGYRSMPTFIADFKQKYSQAPLAFREMNADKVS